MNKVPLDPRSEESWDPVPGTRATLSERWTGAYQSISLWINGSTSPEKQDAWRLIRIQFKTGIKPVLNPLKSSSLTCPRLVVARHLHSKLQSYPRRWSTSRASPLGRGRCLSAIERKVTMKISLGRSDCKLLKFDKRFAESADSTWLSNVNSGWFRWFNKRCPRREGYATGMPSCGKDKRC